MTSATHVDVVAISAGKFGMGSDRFYPEEIPAHRAEVEAFELDRHPVTNRQFSEFVAATGYRTVAEQFLDVAEDPGVSEEHHVPGKYRVPTEGRAGRPQGWRAWWAWTPGASWRHPLGPDSHIVDHDDHPVVQVCFTDASAYVEWVGKRLPTEAEWERAARGGTGGREYAWGDELNPGGELLANTWQGSFPYRNTGAEGWAGTSPVATFSANEYGLVDMIGNVWEWTSTVFTADHRARAAAVENLLAAAPVEAFGCGDGCMCGPSDSGKPGAPGAAPPNPSVRRATKGGFHLCAPEYCRRYRPAARSPQTEDSATTHLGFRCAGSL